MIEFDVDMGYLLECDELDKVVLNDENGEHEPMEFMPIAATVGEEPIEREPDGWYKCPKCGCVVGYDELYGGGRAIVMDDYQIPFDYCPKCGAKAAGE